MVLIVSKKKTSLLNILPLLILYNSISSFVYVLYVTYLIWIQIHAVCVSLWYNDFVNCLN